MVLTAIEVKNAKPGRHADGGGLYLMVRQAADGILSAIVRDALEIHGNRSVFGQIASVDS